MIDKYQNEKIYLFETCKFQREEGSEWEPGVLMNEGRKGILDTHGQIPDKVWDFQTVPGLSLDISELDNWLPYINKWLSHINRLLRQATHPDK